MRECVNALREGRHECCNHPVYTSRRIAPVWGGPCQAQVFYQLYVVLTYHNISKPLFVSEVFPPEMQQDGLSRGVLTHNMRAYCAAIGSLDLTCNTRRHGATCHQFRIQR
jgi:hypothetical protein